LRVRFSKAAKSSKFIAHSVLAPTTKRKLESGTRSRLGLIYLTKTAGDGGSAPGILATVISVDINSITSLE